MKKAATTIIGREAEITDLSDAFSTKQSEFVAVYGRRRVGKTFLIKELFKNDICFEFTGIQNATKQGQLAHFYDTLQKFASNKITEKQPANWLAAFHLLQRYVSKIKCKTKKVIFIDELPWIATQKTGFIQGLDYFWNSWAGWTGDVMLVICGSAASWMIEKILNNTGGLHNRVTKRIRLMPFNLYEAKLFLQAQQVNYGNYELLQLYMIFGGVPHYLKAVKKSKSAAQNVNDICFTKDGLLYTEFENLYSALFKNATHHINVVRVLAKKQKGLTRNEIVAQSKIPSGGTITTVINELKESGFIDDYSPLEKKSKDTLYRLTDEYSLFYLKYIEGTKINGKGTWLKLMTNNSYKVWCGFAFENICLKHIPQIAKGLGISGIGISTASWIHKSTTGGVQIDLLIDRADGVINICEMKFVNNSFTISKSYNEQLFNKLSVFRRVSYTKKRVVFCFVSTYGLTANMYSISNVESSLTMDILFKSE